MRCAKLLLAAIVTVISAIEPLSATEPSLMPTQSIEAAFRAAIEAWAFDTQWRLWGMGTEASRAALSQQDFTERMRRGNAEPAGGGQVEAVDVLSQSATTALVQARFVLRHTRRDWSRVVERPFVLKFEDETWRVNLWDFVGLASYFRPDSLLPRPAPAPRGGRR